MAANFLCDNYRVTLLDFFGFGESPHPEKPLFVDDYVDGVIELINHYKMRDISLVCHSFGARVGLKLAERSGYLLDKLIITDGAGIKPHHNLIYFLKLYRHKILKKFGIKHNAGSKDYRSLSPVMQKTFINIVNEDLTPILSKITLPTLLIWGNKDKATPIYMAKKMRKKICGSGLIVFKGSGHFAYLENSRLFCVIIRNFLSGANNGISDKSVFDNNRHRSIVTIPYSNSKQ